MKTELVPGVAPLVAQYDAFVVDLWGTLHNGIEPLPGALDCCARLKAAGKSIALLSNAPFRVDVVVSVIDRIGVPRELYDCVLSSGEMAWRAVAERSDPWHAALGHRVAFIGNDRHRSMLDNPLLEEVEKMVDADFVMCTGPRQATDTIEDYRAELQAAASRSLPMVCANPDREVIRGEAREICAGAIAQHYEIEFSGNVAWHGKPFPPVFDEVLRILDTPPRARVLMVGDGIHTDIAGAAAADLDGLLICGGIHAAALGITPGDDPAPTVLKAFLDEHDQSPRYASARLRWD
ncbi:MAG: TIGR01459 family HAD-type hydrolase [Alphaproteobacteria bacterium]|nr:TIGR01459 family HAD-type hydrolase [Alphaproteobacteria bacterium]